ncbi:MAG: hypothetical protein ACRDZM_01900, partial [Acidimicrobiia bacterium]
MGRGSSRGLKLSLLVGGLLVALIVGVAAGVGFAGGDGLGDLTGSSPTDPSSSTLAEAAVDPSSPPPTPSQGTSATASTLPVATNPECADLPAGAPFIVGESVQMTDLGEANGVTVEGAIYPRPDYPGDPWSQWGQGWALADGRFYSGLGDHQGPDGNSYLYEYDPASGSLTMIGDLLSYVDDHTPGTWGYGKIHAQMVGGACGEIYLSSYWGSYRDLNFTDTYRGDILFRLDPQRRTIDRLTVPVDQHGQASMAGWAEGGLLYGEA